jgi:hypothetical protein
MTDLHPMSILPLAGADPRTGAPPTRPSRPTSPASLARGAGHRPTAGCGSNVLATTTAFPPRRRAIFHAPELDTSYYVAVR